MVRSVVAVRRPTVSSISDSVATPTMVIATQMTTNQMTLTRCGRHAEIVEHEVVVGEPVEGVLDGVDEAQPEGVSDGEHAEHDQQHDVGQQQQVGHARVAAALALGGAGAIAAMLMRRWRSSCPGRGWRWPGALARPAGRRYSTV